MKLSNTVLPLLTMLTLANAIPVPEEAVKAEKAQAAEVAKTALTTNSMMDPTSHHDRHIY